MKSMLKTNAALSLICLFTLPFSAISLDKEEYSKSYSKSYETSENVRVEISNKYGNVDVISSDNKQVSIEVKVSVEASSDSKGKELLEDILIEITGNSERVSASTTFKPKSNFKNLQIDYLVKIPKNAELKLMNKFGDVVLNQLSGPTNIAVEYGAFRSGNLNNTKNKISIGFGQCSIAYATHLNLTLKYSDKTYITKAKLLNLNSQFSEITIGAVGRLNITSAYDELELTAAAEMLGSLKFTEAEINTITDKIDVDAQYGGFEVEQVSEKFSLFDVSLKFCDAQFNFHQNSTYSIEGRVNFGDIDFDKEHMLVSQKEDHTSISFNGNAKNGAGNSRVIINSSYGDIELDTY